MRSILITGGTGFIGSHTCLMLLKKKYEIFVIDSFINSSSKSINNVLKINKIYEKIDKKIHIFKGDIRDKISIQKVFIKAKQMQKPIKEVIHFAGLKSVRESVLNPLIYWENNVLGTINLIDVMQENDCFNIVFSSSANVYGVIDDKPVNEAQTIAPTSPYGITKSTIEQFLKNIFISSPEKWRIACLRYFNPIGSHPSGLIGESPVGIPNNIFPLILDTAAGIRKEISLFGNDWPTRDGTPLRDYIHVMDLAEGHVRVLEHLALNKPNFINLNLGTGVGTSVLELIKTFESVNKVKVPYIFTSRREGDFKFMVADNSLAKEMLNWEPQRDIKDMCKDGWKWKKLNPNGY